MHVCCSCSVRSISSCRQAIYRVAKQHIELSKTAYRLCTDFRLLRNFVTLGSYITHYSRLEDFKLVHTGTVQCVQNVGLSPVLLVSFPLEARGLLLLSLVTKVSKSTLVPEGRRVKKSPSTSSAVFNQESLPKLLQTHKKSPIGDFSHICSLLQGHSFPHISV